MQTARMRSHLWSAIIALCLVVMNASTALAASRCRYCGDLFGEGMGSSDRAYIERIQAQHEAECWANPANSASDDSYSNNADWADAMAQLATSNAFSMNEKMAYGGILAMVPIMQGIGQAIEQQHQQQLQYERAMQRHRELEARLAREREVRKRYEFQEMKNRLEGKMLSVRSGRTLKPILVMAVMDEKKATGTFNMPTLNPVLVRLPAPMDGTQRNRCASSLLDAAESAAVGERFEEASDLIEWAKVALTGGTLDVVCPDPPAIGRSGAVGDSADKLKTAERRVEERRKLYQERAVKKRVQAALSAETQKAEHRVEEAKLKVEQIQRDMEKARQREADAQQAVEELQAQVAARQAEAPDAPEAEEEDDAADMLQEILAAQARAQADREQKEAALHEAENALAAQEKELGTQQKVIAKLGKDIKNASGRISESMQPSKQAGGTTDASPLQP